MAGTMFRIAVYTVFTSLSLGVFGNNGDVLVDRHRNYLVHEELYMGTRLTSACLALACMHDPCHSAIVQYDLENTQVFCHEIVTSAYAKSATS